MKYSAKNETWQLKKKSNNNNNSVRYILHSLVNFMYIRNLDLYFAHGFLKNELKFEYKSDARIIYSFILDNRPPPVKTANKRFSESEKISYITRTTCVWRDFWLTSVEITGRNGGKWACYSYASLFPRRDNNNVIRFTYTISPTRAYADVCLGKRPSFF